ncbi:MAG: hypothetical protein ACFFAN_09005 [Promethearchaeota archaeon]
MDGNNDLNSLKNLFKRPIRKTERRNESWFFLEPQGVSVALYKNFIETNYNLGSIIISYYTEKITFERTRGINKISVREFMALIYKE